MEPFLFGRNIGVAWRLVSRVGVASWLGSSFLADVSVEIALSRQLGTSWTL